MAPIGPLAIISTHQPLDGASLTMSSDVAVGRMPFASVPATVSLSEAENHLKGGSPPRMPMAQRPTATGVPPPTSSPIANYRLSNIPLFSSPFIAQLVSQGTSEQQLQLASYYTLPMEEPLDTLAPTTIDLFSKVKYLPSNASVPHAPFPRHAPVLGELASLQSAKQNLATQAAQVNKAQTEAHEQIQFNTTQQRATQTGASSAASAPTASGSAPITAGQDGTARRENIRSNERPITTRDGDVVRKGTRTLTSWIDNPPGFDAYVATLARNNRHLIEPVIEATSVL